MSAPSILLLIRALDTGGAQRQLVELATGLHRSGWKVTVATFYPAGALGAPLHRIGVPVVCLGKKGRWDVARFLWRLVRLIRSERPQVAKSYLVMSNILLAALRPLLRGTRVVWAVAAADMDLDYYDWLAKVEFRLSILLSRFADLIIANSEAGLRYHIAQGYAAERMVVIPNGIDVEHFRPDERARGALRAEWGIPEQARLIGLIGRVDPIKDHANFLRAAATIAVTRPETLFVCVGPGAGAYYEEMVALGRRLGLGKRLVWAGERGDVRRVYNALDLLVSASRSEGLPNVVAEAMASGVACVVTAAGDSARLVGDLGWVCPPDDSHALARAIAAALDAPARDRAALRQHVCTHYSTAALVERTAEHLHALLSRGLDGTVAIERRSSA